MKLELKHLAPYLPYKCRGVRYSETAKGNLFTVLDAGNIHSFMDDFPHKPILRPLSDLRNKELDYWIEIAEVTETITPDYLIKSLIEKYSYSMNFENYQKVLEYFNENHFDYMSLIKQGLAIDINTLEK